VDCSPDSESIEEKVAVSLGKRSDTLDLTECWTGIHFRYNGVLIITFLDVAQTCSTASGQKKMWKTAKLITSTAPLYPESGTKYEDINPRKLGK